MKYRLSILFFLLCFISSSQPTKIKIKKQEATPASFPGGNDSLSKYLARKMAVKNTIVKCDVMECEGYVYLDKKGKIEKFELIAGENCKACTDDLTEIVKAMPKWIPATDKLGNNTKDRHSIIYKRKIIAAQPIELK